MSKIATRHLRELANGNIINSNTANPVAAKSDYLLTNLTKNATTKGKKILKRTLLISARHLIIKTGQLCLVSHSESALVPSAQCSRCATK